MKKFYALGVVIMLATSGLWAQERVNGTIMHDNLERAYRLYIPAAYDGQSDWPLVFNFHGRTSTAAQQEGYSAMNSVADTAQFLVCYPDGINNEWNVGWSFGTDVDDVGFVDALIDELSTNYSVDLSRVYSCGMSNGGFMSYRLACERSDRFAAIASVTGSLATNYDCSPELAVPVLQIHGTDDPTVPYQGNAFFTVHIDTTIAFWANHNGCGADPRYVEIDNTNATDMSTVEQFTYTDCNEDSEVMLFKITGGAHTWPGSPLAFPGTNYDINASEEIWRFFSRFSRDISSSTASAPEAIRFQVYPNPGQSQIMVAGVPTHFSARLFNNFGQLVWQNQQTDPTLQLPKLPSGSYFLQVQTEEGVGWQKWVKSAD